MKLIDELNAVLDSHSFGNECVVWEHNKAKSGYGKVRDGMKQLLVHRYTLERVLGRKLDRWEFVCHTCDNPSCYNPNHLFLGTPADNSADMAAKGRSLQGVRHHKAKLTELQVQEIRELLKAGNSQRQIGKLYGVSQAPIAKIHRGLGWKHLA